MAIKEFNSINDLKKYIDSQEGQSAILDEKQMVAILKEAGKQLESYMKYELGVFFSSYTPSVYDRTGDTMKSIKVGNPRKVNINEWTLDITFDKGLANHPSVMGQDDGYTPYLLHAGWKTKLDNVYGIENFTRHKGSNYITKAVKRFNTNNKYGLKVQVFYNEKDITNETYNYGR
ncbi:hypothetical protein [Psychrobacillus phage Perkons]|nr:hypothetical protein [Psychrobacillus phage Perkons]